MSTLWGTVHIGHKGHCGFILETVLKSLKEKGIKSQVIDLYREKFDPILKEEEHYTAGGCEISESNKGIQEAILQERKFIILYPTWWNSTPAILKGFFDRILTSHFAFKYVHGIPLGLLRGKVAVISTMGGGFLVEKVILRSRSLRVVTKDILRFCGFKSRGYGVYSAIKFNDSKKKIIQRKVRKALKYLGV